MELRHLRYFSAVAAHGSFNRAARILHLTQPALSRQVRDLEDELGVPLLMRRTNSVELTEAGEIFYEEAREILARVTQSVQRVRGESTGVVVRIGYAPSATAGILPQALERFQAEHPRAHVELLDISPAQMVQMGKDGRLDVIIALEPSVTAISGYQWSDLRRLNLVLVFRADDPLSRLKRVRLERLHQVPLVGLARETFPDYVPHMRRILKRHGVRPRFVALESDGVSTLFASVEARRAAAILADSVIGIMPRSLVSRPFMPQLESVVARIGVLAVNPKPEAESLARLLCAEVCRGA